MLQKIVGKKSKVYNITNQVDGAKQLNFGGIKEGKTGFSITLGGDGTTLRVFKI